MRYDFGGGEAGVIGCEQCQGREKGNGPGRRKSRRRVREDCADARGRGGGRRTTRGCGPRGAGPAGPPFVELRRAASERWDKARQKARACEKESPRTEACKKPGLTQPSCHSHKCTRKAELGASPVSPSASRASMSAGRTSSEHRRVRPRRTGATRNSYLRWAGIRWLFVWRGLTRSPVQQ